MANYPDEERFLLWSNEGYEKLIEYLKNKSFDFFNTHIAYDKSRCFQ